MIPLSALVSAMWPVNLQDEGYSSHHGQMTLLRLAGCRRWWSLAEAVLAARPVA
jgi:hypothetical protein